MHASRDSLILSLLLPALAPKMIKSAPILRLILALIPQGTGWGNSHCGPVLQSMLCPQRARCLPLLSRPCSKSQPAHKEPRHGGIHHPCPNRKCLGKHISDQRVAAEKAGEHSLHSRDGEEAWNTAVLLFVLVLCQNVMTRRIEREQRHRGPIISRLKHRRCLGVHESLCELQHCWKVSQEVTEGNCYQARARWEISLWHMWMGNAVIYQYTMSYTAQAGGPWHCTLFWQLLNSVLDVFQHLNNINSSTYCQATCFCNLWRKWANC